jgi:hypothetical protein
MLYLSGDLHGDYDIHRLSSQNFTQQKDLTKKDYFINAGDFGLVWYGKENTKYYPQQKYWLDWLNDKNFTTLFVPGNHENYDLLLSNEFERIPMFGDEVIKIHSSIFMLQTGHIYTIDGLKVFAFGGAMSIDKNRRTPYISWWPEEIPSSSQMKMGLDNLAKINNKVDLVLTHATHKKMFDALGFDALREKEIDPLIPYLTQIQETVDYKAWVNGHYHVDLISNTLKTASLYYQIVSYDYLLERFKNDRM